MLEKPKLFEHIRKQFKRKFLENYGEILEISSKFSRFLAETLTKF